MSNQSLDQVKVEFKGREYSAEYAVSKGMVKVTSIYGERSVPIGGMTVEWAARQALEAILKAADARGVLDAY
ncbi:hypothetical protein D3880_10780 [Pseudomonas cavernae]|uniref:Uncharacterized protein n=1 Tax=Pseudomonas cavernae TaxID=2320867 RepID=A0A385Z5Q2_9PSED|nr:hypothetical protein [Pseudomonas cavernae]AYC32832.1 hypothetical protein D3880_10780 [Pseudomonas cavernae]